MIDSKELAVVKTQASKALIVAQEIAIKSVEDMTKATDVLSKIKTVGKLIKERKEAITRPLMESLNSVRDLFKPIESNHAEAERIIKDKMLSFQIAEEKKAEAQKAKIVEKVESGKLGIEKALEKIEAIPEAATNVKGKVGEIVTRTIKKYRVVDESKLPREYLIPNMPKITEALKAGLIVAGAEWYEEKIIQAK